MLGWREVPTDNRMLGPTARASQPVIKQLFIGARHPSIADDDAFERKLYVIRRRARHAVRRLDIPEKAQLLHPQPLVADHRLQGDAELRPAARRSIPTCQDERVESALAMVHSRFSTNTFPSWSRAHPYRMIAHNGEINTLRGNVNWMHARESMFASKLFGDDLKKCIPVIDTERQRLGHVRQRARAAGAGGAVAAARDDDDDPRAVVEPRVDVAARRRTSTSSTAA